MAGYTGSKNPVRNRLKIQCVELNFSKLIFQKSSTDQQGVRNRDTHYTVTKFEKMILPKVHTLKYLTTYLEYLKKSSHRESVVRAVKDSDDAIFMQMVRF